MPLSLLIKPVSSSCNLRCRYCFYEEESSRRTVKNFGRMSEETLELLVRRIFSEATGAVHIAFQGGEPTLAGLSFYETLAALETTYNVRNLPVTHAIQTNGVLLDDAFCAFLAQKRYLVGLSLDGTRRLHDQNRRDETGAGSFSSTLRAGKKLLAAGADVNLLTVLTDESAKDAAHLYRYFKDLGFRYQQYIPCIDPPGAETHFLSASRYQKALCDLFDCWYDDLCRQDPVSIRDFENYTGILAGMPPESCAHAGHCSCQFVVEADGSVYPCDFYVLDDYRLGSVQSDSFADLQRGSVCRRFLEEAVLPKSCLSCPWRTLCRGGCRRDRDHGGALLENYWCEAYRGFFPYAMERMKRIASWLSAR